MGVVAADVTAFRVAGLVAGVEFEVSELLDLEGCEEAFGRCVVPAVSLAVHAASDSRGPRCLAEFAAGILAAAVGLLKKPRLGLP